jgi:hypothetical protein
MARDWLMKELCDRFPFERAFDEADSLLSVVRVARRNSVRHSCRDSVYPSELTDPPVQAEIQAPEEVRTILRHSCYNCHSNETKLSWFDRISPAYWFVTQDVRRARQHVKFSAIGALSPRTQKAVLFDAVNQIQLGAMPPPSYRAVHRDSTITPEQIRVLRRRPKDRPSNCSKPHFQRSDCDGHFCSSRYFRGSYMCCESSKVIPCRM